MIKYITQFDDLNKIMGILYRVLDIRITFFDLQGYEQDSFDIKKMTPFCTRYRNNAAGNQRCVDCDLHHLEFAKKVKRIHIYHCHRGLLEGIIPLYDRHNIYIGSVVFGQLRDIDYNFNAYSKEEEILYSQLKAMTVKDVEDIGLLLKLVSEYIIENEIIRHKNKPWVQLIEEYIRNNLKKRITLNDLALSVRRSPSFISHNFKKAFGMSFKNYILKLKMESAVKILQSDFSVKETAFELGFYDEFHFSKRFKKYFGTSPGKYKNNIRIYSK